MFFADASALIAILAQEEDAAALLDRLRRSDRRFYSAIAQCETIAGLRRTYALDLQAACEGVSLFFRSFAFEIVPISEREANMAVDAASRYGKGRHPASLNMGDCFAYACAKSCGAALCIKGETLRRPISLDVLGPRWSRRAT